MILYLISLISGFNFLMLSLVLFLRSSPYKKQNRYLAFIFLFSGIFETLNSYFNYFIINNVNYLQYYVSIEIILMMFCGPLIYFYTLSITTGKTKFNIKTSIHLISIVPVIIFEVYFALLPTQERINYLVENYHNLFLEVAIENIWFYFQLMIYFSISLWKLNAYRKQLSATMIQKFNNDTNWFRYYIILMLSLLALSLPISVFNNNDKIYIIVGQVIMNIQFVYIFINVLKSSHLFPPDLGVSIDKAKYAGSSLSETQIDKYFEKVINCLKIEKTFINSELTINNLADNLKMSVHCLSQVINTKSGTNFSNFINELRVEESKKLLISDEFNSYTIEAIAFEVGFGTKSGYNKAFKKFTNQTPSEFRKI